jgi:hypothetical protein
VKRIVVAVAAFVALVALPSAAEADATITSSSVRNGFPRDIQFDVTATADADITDLTLSYRIVGRNASAIGKPDFLVEGTSIESTVTVPTDGGDYIPVGSEFTYHWEFTLADGTTNSGPDESFVYLPPGPTWESVENEIVRVYFHGDNADTAQEYLQAGLETYQQIAVDLYGTELPTLPVKVILFAEESDLEAARQGASPTLDAAVLNCGTKVTSDIVFVIHRSCGTGDRTDTFRHEFGHIINEAAGEGPLGVIPAWIDEGMAVHAQTEPGDNYLGAVEAAIRTARLIPFNEMGTAASTSNQVNLFYGQAYAMTDFLIQLEGPARFAEFMGTIKGGTRFDLALEQIYGFDVAGFEEAFYEANDIGGAPPANPTSPASAGSGATAVPSRPPLQTSDTQTSGDDDDAIDTVVIAAGGATVLFLLLAVFFYLFTLMQSQGRASTAGTPPKEDDQWRPPPPPNP